MSHKVLIVEDEIIVADDLEWKLTNLGYQTVGIAVSGEEAVGVAQREQPDIVLMDIQLQGQINGIEAAKCIQRQTGAAIIFVTAYPATLVRDPDQMQPPGVCVSKPFSTLQLKAAMHSATSALHAGEVSRRASIGGRNGRSTKDAKHEPSARGNR
jgi:CheY-like chemotaxis protein